MIIVECQQGSELWLQTRAGVITASKYRDATEKTAKGAPTAKSRLYAAQVAIERISGQPCDEGYNSWQMKRGNELEPLARTELHAARAQTSIWKALRKVAGILGMGVDDNGNGADHA